MTTICWIGLGAMGTPMARNLLAAGFTLRVFNRQGARAAALVEAGATQHASPAAAAAGCHFICSMVSDDEAVRAVLLSAGTGALAGAAPGAVLLDFSTVSPRCARDVHAASARAGCSFLECPVLGPPLHAASRELIIMAGGEAATFARAAPVLSALGRLVRHVGPAGAGAALKLVNNMLSGVMTAAIGEAALAIEAAGIDGDIATELLGQGAAGSRITRTKLPLMLQRRFAPQFALALMEKDQRYFQDMAGAAGLPCPVAAAARAQFAAAKRSGLGALDAGAVFLQAAGEPAPAADS